MANFWLKVSSLFSCIIGLVSFNVDVLEPNIYRGTPGEYFGFAVTLHSSGSSKRHNWLLVGAPLSNRTSNTNSRPGYGAVSWCYTHRSSGCSTVRIDDEEIRKNGAVAVEQKNGQWLGATLLSSGKRGKIVACAPRYAFRGTAESSSSRMYLLGRCFVLDHYLRLKPDMTITPCYYGDEIISRATKIMYTLFGYCQAGFSATFISSSNALAMGTPGAQWRGSVTATRLDTRQTFAFPKQKPMKLRFGDTMGYAMTSGYFKSTDKEEIVSSSPRANNLRGKVVIFDYTTEEKIAISSSLPAQGDEIQPGSYFGSALCAVDINGDGFSDLLVGAPLHTEKKDEGRVYVYMNNGQGALNLAKTLNGDNKVGARFGFSIAAAGDLNQDGYDDTIIGAPYEDKMGAIYIYFGSKDGIDDSPKTPRQKIVASVLKEPVQTFGYSLSGGLDVDQNGYPDIATGAYSSDRAILLKTKPIISVRGELILSTKQIVIESNSSLCKAVDNSLHKCIDIEVCFKFTKPVDDKKEVQVSYKIELEKNKDLDVFRRLYFEDAITKEKGFYFNKTVSIGNEQNQRRCERRPLTAYLRRKENIGDFLSALTFDLSYELHQPSVCSLCPVLDAFTGNSYRAEATFQKQCGVDEVCVPNLAVEGAIKFPRGQRVLAIGVVDKMWVEIRVENKGDDAAYPGKVIVTYPPIIGYIGPEANQGVQCKKQPRLNEDNLQEVECLVGNPFRGKAKKRFHVEFSTSALKGNISEFFVQLAATSAVNDTDYSDNRATLNVTVKFEADLKISGSSEPDQVLFKDNGKKVTSVEEIGPEVQQTIIVRNEGPSSVDGAQVSVNVPSLYDANDPQSHLLYLISVEVQGGSCDAISSKLNFQENGNMTAPIAQTSTSAQKKATRQKRDSSIKVKEVNCKQEPSRCKTFTCRLARLNKGDSVEIQLYSRLWQNTLVKADSDAVDLVTIATVKAPSTVSEPWNDNNNEVVIYTRASPVVVKQLKKEIPWWIILLAGLGGALLLALIIFIMWKAGFFRRKSHKRASMGEEEMEPMNKESPGGNTDEMKS